MGTPKFAMQVQFKRIELVDDDASPNDYLFQDEEYREADQARLDAYNAGEWHFIGIRAKALSFESPGLWAIESDSGADYLNEVYGEEVETLKGIIRNLASPTFE